MYLSSELADGDVATLNGNIKYLTVRIGNNQW